MNSRLLDFYLKKVSTNFHGGYFAANKQYIEQLPISPINFSDKSDKAKHDKIDHPVLLQILIGQAGKSSETMQPERAAGHEVHEF